MATQEDVRSALSHLSSVEFEESDLANGVRVAVDESEAGHLFKTIRVRGYDAQSKRIGDTIVSHISADESRTLGDLFG